MNYIKLNQNVFVLFILHVRINKEVPRHFFFLLLKHF